jgi:hypothetical protein
MLSNAKNKKNSDPDVSKIASMMRTIKMVFNLFSIWVENIPIIINSISDCSINPEISVGALERVMSNLSIMN